MWRLKSVFEWTIALKCSSGVFTLKVYLRNHLLEDLERFESFSFMDVGSLEHFSVLIEQYYTTTSR